MSEARRAESNGGEGRTRTFEGAGPTDLQSAAFDRFATSPMPRPHISATAERAPAGRRLRGLCLVMSGFAPFDYPCGIGRAEKPFCDARLMELAKGFEPPTG